MDTKPIELQPTPTIAPEVALSRQQLTERRELVKAVKAINATELLGENYELTYSVDRGSRRLVLKIVNRQTNEVVRQLPSEYALRVAESLQQGQ